MDRPQVVIDLVVIEVVIQFFNITAGMFQ